MKVELLEHTSLWVCANAIRSCWASQGKSDTDKTPFLIQDKAGDFKPPNSHVIVCGPSDKALIDRVGNKFKHASTLEHLNYSFSIEGVSRALLQELARHRIASLSVKSTRYTLKELKKTEMFWTPKCAVFEMLEDKERVMLVKEFERASEFVVFTDDKTLNIAILKNLENLRFTLSQGISNDKAKYSLPEAYKTSLSWTINARSLQNFLSLRTSKAALWEIRDLANTIFEALPEEHKYLFEDSVSQVSDVTITQDEYNELKEFKAMYEGLCD